MAVEVRGSFLAAVALASYLFDRIHTARPCVEPLGSIRPHLCLTVSLLDHIDPTYGDALVGIDSRHHTGAIFVSGVFCRIALMSLLADAAPLVPSQFSVYQFHDISHAEDRHRKLFFPKVGFVDDTEAIGVTRLVSITLANFHEEIAQKYS